MMTEFFATTPPGMEDLLAQELEHCHAHTIDPTHRGVRFNGDIECAYRACLWSRTANRVLMPLATIDAADADTLYKGIQSLEWQRHVGRNASLAVDFIGTNAAINNSQFGVQKVKDAIVDQLRALTGQRPAIDTSRPDVRINVYLRESRATVSLDLAGDSLHRRGYRGGQGEAPLKENLAAAILLRAGWPGMASKGDGLIDPMCGSGTLLIEAALIAGDIAPGLLRDYFGFPGWTQHDADLWQGLLEEARRRRDRGLQDMPPIEGSDQDRSQVESARRNIERAGLAGHIRVEHRAINDCVQATTRQRGLVVCNPPYGERLGGGATLPVLYRQLGLALKRCWPGWRAAVFTGDAGLARYIGLRAHRKHTLYNGALRCTLLHFDIAAGQQPAVEAAGRDFANRLRKNLRHLGKWATREGIACFRVYDADLPEYNLAIDIYGNEQHWVHIQEYEAPAGIDAHKAQLRLNAALACIPEILDVPPSNLFLKQRRRQRQGGQYEKLDDSRQYHIVREGPAKLWVNFTDYLDTGLFLDHRPTRALIHELAADRHFLNLFGYTGSATVFAALGGAADTTTVDLSRTYLDWTRRNLMLNDLDLHRHELIRSDVLPWLHDNRQRQFDLIFLDPPAFSRSRRMSGTLDVQRDHAALIDAAMQLLANDGLLLFSTNLRRFNLDPAVARNHAVEDITRSSIPPDFARNTRTHRCYRIRHLK